MTDIEQLVAEAREEDWHAAGFSNTLRLMHELADALTAVSAERDAAQRIIESHTCGENVELAYRRTLEAQADRDRLHKAITEALETAPKLGEMRWRNVDRMIGILRTALDKEGSD